MKIALLAAGALLVAAPSWAQSGAAHDHGKQPTHPGHGQPQTPSAHGQAHGGHDQMMMAVDPARHGGPAASGYHHAMMTMHQGMMQVNESDPARAWAAMMISHHQGAIDSARVLLEHAEDAEIRRMAEETIRAQEEEIAGLRSWLERH